MGFYCVFLLSLFFGCILAQYNVSFADSRVQYQGRWFQNSTAATADWAGVSVRLTFNGTISISYVLSTSGSDYINVFVVDSTGANMATQVSALTTTPSSIVISGLNPSVTYTITINKRTEPMYGIMYFYGFQLDNGATVTSTTPKSSRRMEFIGASMINGLANMETSTCTSATSANENAWLSFGPVLARNFSADWHMEAWSGKGVTVNADNTTTFTLPQIFTRVIANDASYGVWDTTKWQPDLILFNLGTNDFSIVPQVNITLFLNTFTAFVNQLYTYYPNKPAIIMTCGPRFPDSQLCPTLQTLASQLNVPYVDYRNSSTLLLYPEDTSCGFHPSYLGDAKMAAKTVPVARSLLSSKWGLTTTSTTSSSSSIVPLFSFFSFVFLFFVCLFN